MNLKYLSACLAAAAALALAGCGSSGNGNNNQNQNNQAAASDNSPVVATVNGEPIHQSTLTTFIDKRTGGAGAKLSPQDRQTLLDQLVNLKVLAEQARQQGIARQDDVQAEIQIQRQALLANALVHNYLEQNPVSDQQVEQAYNDQVKGMDQKEYKARHILVTDKKTAEQMIDKLDHGADFAALAKKTSTGPSAKSGGELGWFSPSDMVKPFAQAVEKLKKGKYTKQPVKTQFGWHVILLEDTREVPKPALNDLKPAIQNKLRAQQVEAYVNKLRSQAKVEIKQQQAGAAQQMPTPATGSQNMAAPAPASSSMPQPASGD